MDWGAISTDEAQQYTLTVMASRFAEVLSTDEVIKRIHQLD